MTVGLDERERRAMAIRKSGTALKHLETLFNVGTIGTLTDGQLLERFATDRGECRELAFAALVERHGPIVLRVCRGVLRDEHDAHDAFQATFLALARKAEALCTRESLGPWLHQAAHRAAFHDRSARLRRRAHERAAAGLRPERVDLGDDHNGVERLIHEEIDRLPARFRCVVVLCDLEGRSREQAARHLGCAVGTVKSRLTRAREKLRGRLVRRGVASGAGGVTVLLAGAPRTVPPSLAETTVSYAAGHAARAGAVPAPVVALTEGVLTSMFLSKLKIAVSITIIAATLTVGIVAFAQQKDDRSQATPVEPTPAVDDDWTYEVIATKAGMEPRKLAVVRLPIADAVRINAPGAVIVFEPKRLAPKAGDAQVLERYRRALLKQVDEDAVLAALRKAGITQEVNGLLKDATCVACHRTADGSSIEAVNALLRNATGTHAEVLRAIEQLSKHPARDQPAAPKAVDNRPRESTRDQAATPKASEKQPRELERKNQPQTAAAAKSGPGDRLDQLEKKVDSILEMLKAPSRKSDQ
jgi:RNA polymerase sigma factor (sigma-70 family)